MSKYFMFDSELQELEQLMMLVPNFLPRGSGVVVVHGFANDDHPSRVQVPLPNVIDQFGFETKLGHLYGIEESYERLLSKCFHECKFYRFRSRLEYMIRKKEAFKRKITSD